MSFIYNRALKQILSGEINLTSDTIKVMLVDSGYTPNADHDFVDNGMNDASDPSFNELSGTGYIRQTLGSKTFQESDANDRGEFDAADVTFEDIDAGTADAAILYVEGNDDTDSVLLAYIDDGGFPRTTNGGDLTIQWNANGILHAVSG